MMDSIGFDRGSEGAITSDTERLLAVRICDYARLCGKRNWEVAFAVLSSETLKRLGYVHDRKGRLTEAQGRAALRVLDHWIAETEELERMRR